MSRFKKKTGRSTPEISTASLPDIIFILLFFFMVATVLRETDLKIKVTVPQATELTKLERKSLVSYIYIGIPIKAFQAKLGTAPRVQLNDVLSGPEEVIQFIENERTTRAAAEIPYMTTSLRVDQKVTMGIVSDVKQELRKANALKINYSASLRAEDN